MVRGENENKKLVAYLTLNGEAGEQEQTELVLLTYD